MKKSNIPTTVDEYISSQPKEVQPFLKELRSIIRKAAPDAEETISYQMPAYKQEGVLVFFGGWKNHCGFYPTSTPTAAFKEKLAKYTVSKGAIQFPYDKPLPVQLITAIVKFKIKENLEKKSLKSITKKKVSKK
ncbi:MAG: DUF1801 domain-containing protein [Chitinophagaceae bacterium]|nr:DUF1801 domain-containing protein [Chitinophagaceae bacterium]